MGEIRADVTLENPSDRAVVDRGYGRESDIRRSTIDAIVDTGAVTLVLPQNVVERLGLEQVGLQKSNVVALSAGQQGEECFERQHLDAVQLLAARSQKDEYPPPDAGLARGERVESAQHAAVDPATRLDLDAP